MKNFYSNKNCFSIKKKRKRGEKTPTNQETTHNKALTKAYNLLERDIKMKIKWIGYNTTTVIKEKKGERNVRAENKHRPI